LALASRRWRQKNDVQANLKRRLKRMDEGAANLMQIVLSELEELEGAEKPRTVKVGDSCLCSFSLRISSSLLLSTCTLS
jgi:hypothetical protein